jgi:hypothetical protein
MKSPLWFAAAGILATVSAHAGTIVDQSPPNLNAIDMVDSRVADDFVLSSALTTIDTVNFWYQAYDMTDLSTVAWAFYSDSGGTPGSLLYSDTASPIESIDTNAFFASFSVPDLTFTAGTYWLELHAGSSLTDNTNDTTTFTVWWSNVDGTPALDAVTDSGLGLPGAPETVPGYQEMAFQLLGNVTTSGGPGGGSPAPEPSSFLLATGGIAVAAWLKRRRTI